MFSCFVDTFRPKFDQLYSVYRKLELCKYFGYSYLIMVERRYTIFALVVEQSSQEVASKLYTQLVELSRTTCHTLNCALFVDNNLILSEKRKAWLLLLSNFFPKSVCKSFGENPHLFRICTNAVSSSTPDILQWFNLSFLGKAVYDNQNIQRVFQPTWANS